MVILAFASVGEVGAYSCGAEIEVERGKRQGVSDPLRTNANPVSLETSELVSRRGNLGMTDEGER